MSYDVIIIGAGIMGQLTALRLQEAGRKVAVLDRYKVGNPKAASSGLTRSIRKDYLDPFYANLAIESQSLWSEFERQYDVKIYERSGLVNLASKKITPDLGDSYAAKSRTVLGGRDRPAMPSFQFDLLSYDTTGGVLRLKTIRERVLQLFRQNNILLFEDCEIVQIERAPDSVSVKTKCGDFQTKKLAICAGLESESVLRLVGGFENADFGLTIKTPDEVRYFDIPDQFKSFYSSPQLPVFACLDMGVYGHPIVPGYTDYLKISYYTPPEVKETGGKRIDEFCALFMPQLLEFRSFPITDTDQCAYDYTRDQDFIVGAVDAEKRIYIATGWNGTGYKFAPVIARILSQSLSGAATTLWRFDPMRFLGRDAERNYLAG